MKKSSVKKINVVSVAGILLMASAMSASATIVNLFTEDLSAFGVKIESNNAPFHANIVVPPVNPFNDGNALHMYDYSTQDKPELQGELGSALLEPFQIDFSSLNLSADTNTSQALRFRMGNSGDSITSEGRVAFSVSWQGDGELTAKYSNPLDGIGDVDTKSSDVLVGIQSITMVANGALAGTYSYSAFGESRVLNPLSYDVFIGGVLLNDSASPSEINGLQFHYDKSGTSYDPTLGLQRFGIVGSGDSAVGYNYLYDNIILKTGDDIVPEPTTLGLALISMLVMFGRRNRR